MSIRPNLPRCAGSGGTLFLFALIYDALQSITQKKESKKQPSTDSVSRISIPIRPVPRQIYLGIRKHHMKSKSRQNAKRERQRTSNHDISTPNTPQPLLRPQTIRTPSNALTLPNSLIRQSADDSEASDGDGVPGDEFPHAASEGPAQGATTAPKLWVRG